MPYLPVQTLETAPEASKPFLEGAKKAFGFVPNLMAVFANSPAMVEAYGALSEHFEKTALTATERQIVLMTNSRLNECEYCMSAHSTVSQMQKVPADIVSALRSGTEIADPKLQALHVFTARINEARGNVNQEEADGGVHPITVIPGARQQMDSQSRSWCRTAAGLTKARKSPACFSNRVAIWDGKRDVSHTRAPRSLQGRIGRGIRHSVSVRAHRGSEA